MGAIGLFRLQILRDQMREAEFEYRARVRLATGQTHAVPIERVFELADAIPQQDAAKREHVAAGRKEWEDAEPYMRRTIYALVGFEAWILFVILISLGGLAHVPVLAGCPLSSAGLIVELDRE